MFKPINTVIKTLIASDVLLITGFGFISPILAIFITQKIAFGDTAEAAKIAGFSMAIYWGIKSLLEIPLGNYLDKNHGEKDDVIFAMIGNGLAAFSAILYIFSSQAWHIYVLEAIYSVGMAMNIPAWTAMFTRHIDQGKEAFEWATRSTFIGIGAGAAGALGGLIASNFGFNFLFITVAVFVLLSSLILFAILKMVSPRNKKIPRTPETKTLQEPYLPKE
jgi:predicted MFS family arabinose efflux permease